MPVKNKKNLMMHTQNEKVGSLGTYLAVKANKLQTQAESERWGARVQGLLKQGKRAKRVIKPTLMQKINHYIKIFYEKAD